MHLYISNLSLDATEDDLAEAFGRFGAVTKIVILTDPVTSNPLGNAVVTMPINTQAKEAVEHLNLTKIRERMVLVSLAPETKNRRKRPRDESSKQVHLKASVSF